MARQVAIIAVLGLGIAGVGLLGCKSETRNQPGLAETQESSPSPSDGQTAHGSAAEITGLRAELIDQETALDGWRVSWSTRWRLCWTPIPGAVGYMITTATPEGIGPAREIAEPCHAMTVANDITTRPGERPSRSHQLSQMRLSLSISVAAKLGDGRIGPSSPDIPVGAEHP